jgi:hypothetical protein
MDDRPPGGGRLKLLPPPRRPRRPKQCLRPVGLRRASLVVLQPRLNAVHGGQLDYSKIVVVLLCSEFGSCSPLKDLRNNFWPAPPC